MSDDHCKNCGACKTCGRGGRQQFAPYYPWYPQTYPPYYVGDVFPYPGTSGTGTGKVTWTSNTTNSAA